MLLKLAFLMTIPVYCLVAYLATPGMGPAAEAAGLLRPVFAAMFVVYALVAIPVGNQMQARAGVYHVGVMIVRLAFYEAGAILGLVLAFLSHDYHDAVYFAIPSFLLIFFTPASNVPNPRR